MKVALKTKSVGLDEYAGKSIDEIVVGIARVSSSREINELFDEPEKLLRHCLLQGHWSIFDTVNLGFEIKTSRAMGREMLRHDFKKQEFSQRYQAVTQYEPIELRAQAKNNRQSSTEVVTEWDGFIKEFISNTFDDYTKLLDAGVARESARLILPEATSTVLFLNGTLRTWMSFLNQRLHKTAQKEIRIVAEAVKDSFIEHCPIISKMLFNFEDSYDIHIFERLVLEKYKIYNTVKSGIIK